MWLWAVVILAAMLAAAIILYQPFVGWYKKGKAGEMADNEALQQIIEDAGYSYDSSQDIFYSNMNPWQRKMGYCRLYDEASVPMNLIIDCEPIYFEYGGKRWMIEFWKGQYGMAAGGEIGVYTTEGSDLNIPGFFYGTFYNCAADEDRLYMVYGLYKNGELLYERIGRHWWLTGFKLGEFAEPSELAMHLTIVLKTAEMCDAFVKGLRAAGYSEEEFYRDGRKVSIVFEETHTAQPLTRIPEIEWAIQRKNELLCNKYQEITGEYEGFPDKMNAIRETAPELYDAVLSIGKTKQLFDAYEKIKNYIS